AARHADHVNIIAGTGREGYISLKAAGAMTEQAFLEKTAFLRDEAKRLGRDGDRIEVSQTIFTLLLVDDPKQARAMTDGFAGLLARPRDRARRSPLFLAGTPEECVRELRRRKTEWGLAETIFSYRDPAVLRRLGEHVLPYV